MSRDEVVDILTEIYSREDAETRVVQVSPDAVEVNCEVYQRNLRSRAHANRSAELDAKALFASKGMCYREQEDGMILVPLKAAVLA